MWEASAVFWHREFSDSTAVTTAVLIFSFTDFSYCQLSLFSCQESKGPGALTQAWVKWAGTEGGIGTAWLRVLGVEMRVYLMENWRNQRLEVKNSNQRNWKSMRRKNTRRGTVECVGPDDMGLKFGKSLSVWHWKTSLTVKIFIFRVGMIELTLPKVLWNITLHWHLSGMSAHELLSQVQGGSAESTKECHTWNRKIYQKGHTTLVMSRALPADVVMFFLQMLLISCLWPFWYISNLCCLVSCDLLGVGSSW